MFFGSQAVRPAVQIEPERSLGSKRFQEEAMLVLSHHTRVTFWSSSSEDAAGHPGPNTTTSGITGNNLRAVWEN